LILGKVVKVLALILLVSILGVIAFFSLPVSQNAHFQENEKITLVIYDNGHIKKEIVFPPNSDLHKRLNEWLKKHSSNWQHTIVSYAPSVYLNSEGISLNILRNGVVINYAQQSDSTYTQVIQEFNGTKLQDELLR
jgi:hypothetical protein